MAGLQEAEFLRDVEKHEMLVLRDDGIYRHIRFKEPGTMCMHFVKKNVESVIDYKMQHEIKKAVEAAVAAAQMKVAEAVAKLIK